MPVSSSAYLQKLCRLTLGEAEFYGFVDCLLQSLIKYDKHLRDGTQLLSDVEKSCWNEIPSGQFPGSPPASPLWAHATTREGATGILATGKSFPRNIKLLA